MELTSEAFATYLLANEGTSYELPRGTVFTFQLKEPRDPEFPYSIRFSSKTWSLKTTRAIGAKRIVDFLAIFNRNPDGPLDQYRNRRGAGSRPGSPARVATYLVPLMQEALRATGSLSARDIDA